MTMRSFLSPVIILGSPRSFTSLICAMLGQHPQVYGVPELNLFIAETLKELIEELGGYRQIQIHGLVRTVSHLYAGEQTLLGVDMARRWMLTRLERTTAEIYYELCDKVFPLRIVDKSPVYSLKQEYLQRIKKAFPEAFYIHLVRHPLTQGESIMNVATGLMAILSNSIDYEVEPPVVDPQIGWYETQTNIMEFLKDIPDNHKLQLRGEDILNDKINYLKKICQWLGLFDDDSAIDAMLHPEDSPYACLGPVGAHLGNDINFLRSPELRNGNVKPGTLDKPLPWREDGKGFMEKVLDLARKFNYS